MAARDAYEREHLDDGSWDEREEKEEEKEETPPAQPSQPPAAPQPPDNGGTGGDTPGDTGSGGGSSTPPPGQDSDQYRYDHTANEAYMQALAALQAALANMPSYAGTYDQQLQDLYAQIIGRDKFSYNLNEDALYQQYKDQYVLQGQMAMMDAMGQAASMTGGFGNSFSQGVGQQQYQGYLQRLNDVVPELYGMALDQYNQEGQNMLNQYAMLGDMAQTEYSRYMDAMDQYWQNLNWQKQQADDAYERGYNEWYTALMLEQDADDRNYSRQQDAYEKLVEMMTNMGYTPTAEELAAAGMSESEAKAFMDYYNQRHSYNPGNDDGNGGDGTLPEYDWNEMWSGAADAYERFGEGGLVSYLNNMMGKYNLSEEEVQAIIDAIIQQEQPQEEEDDKPARGNGGR